MQNTNEQWRPVEGYALYMISNRGRIKSSYRNGCIMKASTNTNGYLVVSLSEKGELKQKKVHRLVGIAFVDNHHGKKCVDHIDGNKENNHASNLRWLTSSENQKAFMKVSESASSKYRGVSFMKDRNKFTACASFKGKSINLGRFKTEIEAARRFNKFALKFGYQKEALNII